MASRIGRTAQWFNRIRAVTRLLICLGIAVLLYGVLRYYGLELFTRLIVSWDGFCLSLITFCWITFFITPKAAFISEAQQQDESRLAIFIIVLASLCISLGGILLLMKSRNEKLVDPELHYAASMAGVALSWILLHTTFTLRYAHLYYAPGGNGHHRGLEFPGEDHPDYLDFAYFSFVLGMTFQVADVSIVSRRIRRLALMHGLIAFVYNTIVVALTISILANLPS